MMKYGGKNVFPFEDEILVHGVVIVECLVQIQTDCS